MRILIAEDEAIIRMGLKAMLQEMGHEVYAAADGREALRLARQFEPDMAILDIKMPKTDGLQAAQTLARIQPMPILLLTAFSQADLVERATELPIQGYLLKPVLAPELSAAIAVATKRFAESKALEAENAELEEKLETRKLVEKAKGKLMERGLSEEEAYHVLQQHARANRLTLKEVAEAVLR